MTNLQAAQSGSFAVGGDILVHRLGFGAMRITGEGIWGEPQDRAEASATLRRLPELGVNFIDTADSYGPEVSENLIREALHPYDGHADRHQGRADPHGPGQMDARRPARNTCAAAVTRACAGSGSSGSTCGSCIGSTPRCRATSSSAPSSRHAEEGLIRHVGLSEVGVEDIEPARLFFRSRPCRTSTTW